MTIKKHIPALMTIGLIVLGACSEEKSVRVGEAEERARQSAAKLIESDHSDTIGLERIILDAKAIEGEYTILGDTVAAQAFDKAFRAWVTENDKELAKAMF